MPEVRPEDAPATAGPGGDVADRDRRGVAGEDRVRRRELPQLAEDLLLDREDLGAGFDHQLGVNDRRRELGLGSDQGENRVGVGAEQLEAGADPLERGAERLSARVIAA